jgi:hypothetical protein
MTAQIAMQQDHLYRGGGKSDKRSGVCMKTTDHTHLQSQRLLNPNFQMDLPFVPIHRGWWLKMTMLPPNHLGGPHDAEKLFVKLGQGSMTFDRRLAPQPLLLTSDSAMSTGQKSQATVFA